MNSCAVVPPALNLLTFCSSRWPENASPPAAPSQAHLRFRLRRPMVSLKLHLKPAQLNGISRAMCKCKRRRTDMTVSVLACNKRVQATRCSCSEVREGGRRAHINVSSWSETVVGTNPRCNLACWPLHCSTYCVFIIS